MTGIGKAIKGSGLLAKKYKKGVAKKAAIQTGKRNIESKKLFENPKYKPSQKALKKAKKYIKKNPHEGVPSQSSDWPYWRGEE